MKISKTLMAAAFGLSVGLAAVPALAQNNSFAQMDEGQWHRFWDHLTVTQQRLDDIVQSGRIDPRTALDLQKELDLVKLNSVIQRKDPGENNNYAIWQHLHHVHEAIGGHWEREFDHD